MISDSWLHHDGKGWRAGPVGCSLFGRTVPSPGNQMRLGEKLMMKITIVALASLALAVTAGAQMTGGNSSMQAGSMSGSGSMTTTTPKKHISTHKKTMHKTTKSTPGMSNGSGTMGNTM